MAVGGWSRRVGRVEEGHSDSEKHVVAKWNIQVRIFFRGLSDTKPSLCVKAEFAINGLSVPLCELVPD